MQRLLNRLEEGQEPHSQAGQEEAEAQEQGQRQDHHKAGGILSLKGYRSARNSSSYRDPKLQKVK